jgi:hypothetical protein
MLYAGSAVGQRVTKSFTFLIPVAIPLNGTGAIVTDAVPLLPSLVAVIVIGPPTATPVTNPLADTLAMPAFEDDHVIVRPLRTLLSASRVTAAS